VPLPEGWAASAGPAGVLEVGPKGRVLVTLERRAGSQPSLDLLKEAVEAEGATVAQAAGAAQSCSLRYRKGVAEGLLCVRTLETGLLLLCASTPAADGADLDAAQTLCAGARLEEPH
jgi:hypothetical protein